ncbi:MAG: Crp/Fnr family transcriptional regulator [Methylocystis sp.]|uniref:Crp/Fnr family transcriptional regulator n=1 Tax=Methylocystis sp. TaxID=1911079 RepID=UPI003955D55F
MTIEAARTARNFDEVQRKRRAGRRAPLPAGPDDLRKASLFADVDEETLSRLSVDAKIESLQDGDALFRQGDRLVDVSFVVSGYVKLMRTAPSGRQTLIGIRSDGELIGEVPAGDDEVHTVSAESVGAAKALKLPAPRFARQLKQSPSLCAAVIRDGKENAARLVGEIESLKSQNADQRLAHFLLALCPPHEDRCRFRLPYDKRLIAARLGVKQETLSRAFAKLRAHGVRTETRNVHVDSVSHLADQCDRLGERARLVLQAS